MTMGEPRLTSPRVRVVREGHEDLEVQTTNQDLVLWDRTRPKHKWPTFEDAPFLWLTFLAWAAARRTGAIDTAVTYERWEAEVLGVTSVEDEEDDESGRPTHAGAEPA